MWLPQLGGASPDGCSVDQTEDAVSRTRTTMRCPGSLLCQPYKPSFQNCAHLTKQAPASCG